MGEELLLASENHLEVFTSDGELAAFADEPASAFVETEFRGEQDDEASASAGADSDGSG